MEYYNDITPTINGTDSSSGPSAALTGIAVFLLFFSIFIITLFSILERCSGAPGAGRCCCCMCRIFPVDLLSVEGFRFGHVAAFGCTSSEILYIFSISESLLGQTSWSKSLSLMTLALVLGLAFYPFSYCLTTPWVFLGSVLGLMYAGTWFGLSLYMVDQNADKAIQLIVTFPQILCYVALFSAYSYRLVKHATMVWRSSGVNLIAKKKETYSTADNNKQYVRNLFNKQDYNFEEGGSTTSAMGELLGFLSKWIYQNDPNFRYSTRILSVTAVSLICAYQIGGTLAVQFARCIQLIQPELDRLNEIQPVNETQSSAFFDVVVLVLKLYEVLLVSGIVAFLIASIFTVYSIAQILVNYRRNLKKMFRGSYRHLPFNRENTEAHVILSASLEFAGSQVAYILWGYFVVCVTFTIIGFLVACLIILPIAGVVPDNWLQPVKILIPPFLVLVLQKYLKTMLCKRMFLETRRVINDKGDEEEKTVLALKNSQCFHNVSYFMFFFYAVLGIWGCLLTIVKSIVLGLFYLARLDKCTLCQGFEKWDRGYMIYLSFLYVEATHRHPVVLVFCDLLMNGAACETAQMKYLADQFSGDEESPTSTGNLSSNVIVPNYKLARNRWLKAYTLIRNPSLIKLNDSDDNTIIAGSEAANILNR